MTRSKCCNAPAIAMGFITRYYECTKCKKACDITEVSTKNKKDEKTYDFGYNHFTGSS